MNRIEEKMALLKEKNKKALITYMVAGLPDMEGTKELIKAQEEAGVDVIELGIPFSDPVADDVISQNASYKSICKGTNLKKVFRMMEEIREEGVNVPIIFMMYYNTILGYGVGAFAARCKEAGVDGIVIPDLPFEEQEELQEALDKNQSAIIIQTVSPLSKDREALILEKSRGFVCCMSSSGENEPAEEFNEEIIDYVNYLKRVSKIPVILGFGVRTPKDMEPLEDVVDGASVGSYFVQLLEDSNYSVEAAKSYCREWLIS